MAANRPSLHDEQKSKARANLAMRLLSAIFNEKADEFAILTKKIINRDYAYGFYQLTSCMLL